MSLGGNMELKKNDDKFYVILEENEKVYLGNHSEEQFLQVNNKDNQFVITGDSSLISSIRGEGMLEKVYIPPVFSQKEILGYCDEWLQQFYVVHDLFKKLVLSPKYFSKRARHHLEFDAESRYIGLHVTHSGSVIHEGPSIFAHSENEDVYRYLVLNVLNYYLQKNFSDDIMNSDDFINNYSLFSSTHPFVINTHLYSFYQNGYGDLIDQIIKTFCFSVSPI